MTIATAYTLEGSLINTALDHYRLAEDLMPEEEQGYLLNNLGMANFFKFVTESEVLKESPVEDHPRERILKVVALLEIAIDCLKRSVWIFENFKEKFSSLNLESSQGYKALLAKNSDYNEKFLAGLFSQPQSTLPVQNLGEIAFIMQELKGAFTLLDVAMKLYKGLDQGNLLKYKVLSLLGSLLETQKDSEAVKKVNDTIFKQLEGVHCYEKVFA
eukprot:CAMPEP_0202979946 /NCGR_PEP_ID=MMETSP1396-20130829/85962_1 /ASSEMBLY_ACC=CAM_ASM_000872 /TAXON_ID= /ORGANISM="Pseudokeronopsis sp., Strain Brazil" /LENGTH=214 /DNA_ID=CAMNT_0049719609 /DNA_START=397 /DNA_END=1039 /DNA_ORIENTATION=+